MRFKVFLASFLLMLGTIGVANASEERFFTNIAGKWSGPGEIVAGKFKGTKFVCNFDGITPSKTYGMNVDGSCRVGVFAQPMKAAILKQAGQYVGSFLDGAKGDGMDITGGRYTQNRLVVDVKRADLNGIMVANLEDPNKLNVTISVRHEGRIIPVIGMTLDRKTDNMATGSLN